MHRAAVFRDEARARPALVRAARLGTDALRAAQLCSTLAVLHGQGSVHRDVNPRNIPGAREDQPVLVDFGLATRFAVSESRERIDVAGVTMGTLAYAAPEQLRGELVDPRADLYAVGCIL